jgi:2-oxoglutarate dehydrogenase E1 component
MMYRMIREHPTVRELYAEQLVTAGIMDIEETDRLVEAYQEALARNDIVSRPLIDGEAIYPKPSWSPYHGKHWTTPYHSGLPREEIQALSDQILELPEGFVLHPRTQAILEGRRAMSRGTQPIDWGFAETLAYASLLKAGVPIRLSGQDVGRGTFFHRHATLHDQATGKTYTPLQQLGKKAAEFQIYDSLLSEEGALGFEYGYSSSAPEVLVIWEAQFGDFANNAQVVIDQFIASGESKWGRLCGLTLFLPHGYEGQGPEHSSARIERYLQLCAEDNMQVVVPTTPSQIFHLLRRQIIRPYRKPLIVMTPKSLLRHRLAVSSLDDLSEGRFENVIREIDDIPSDHVDRIVICSGKVYFDLLEARRKERLSTTAIIRIEQLYPFPESELQQAIARYPNITTVVWCQEEPENQGAWHQIRDAISQCISATIPLSFAARPVCAAPAVGQYHRHLSEQRALIENALTGLHVNPQSH